MDDKNTDATDGLLDELSSALADMGEAIKAGNTTADEIAGSLADLVAAIEAKKDLPMGELVAAVKALRLTPAITVKNEIAVPPAHVTNVVQPAPVQILERATPSDYEVTPSYDRHGVITKMLITRVKAAA